MWYVIICWLVVSFVVVVDVDGVIMIEVVEHLVATRIVIVSNHMSLQVGISRKSFTTYLADERSNSGVSELMTFQITALYETSLTNVARVGFHTGMCACVYA